MLHKQHSWPYSEDLLFIYLLIKPRLRILIYGTCLLNLSMFMKCVIVTYSSVISSPVLLA